MQPKTYTTCKIYKIFDSEHPDMFYIGSTYTTLKQRLSKHKTDSKTRTSKFYKYIREVGFDRMVMQLVKSYDEPMTVKQLRVLEGVYQRNTHAPLNMNVAGRTHNEYMFENKDKIKSQKISDEFDLMFTDSIKIVRRKRVTYNIIETPEEQPMTEEEQAKENEIKLTPEEAAEEIADDYEVVDEADVEYLDI